MEKITYVPKYMFSSEKEDFAQLNPLEKRKKTLLILKSGRLNSNLDPVLANDV